MQINESCRILIQWVILLIAVYVLYETAEVALASTKGHASIYRWIGCELVVIAMISLLRIKRFQISHGIYSGACSVVQVVTVHGSRRFGADFPAILAVTALTR